ncbi:MAG: hypothetical protein SGBAC_005231 [Bacillariaceae sp.]
MTTKNESHNHKNANAEAQSPEFLTPSDFESSSKQRSLLLHNLQHSGWSPISMKVSGKTKKWILPPTKDAVFQVMQEQDPNANKNEISRYTYRTAESGGGNFVEPKESVELKRSDVVISESSSPPPPPPPSSLVDEWCWAMSEIAQSVTHLLELPTNTLLAKEEEGEARNKGNCLDLLRVFSYHATPDGPQLGSSPHTDWGSWTIVWQDDVGGLETYSREHQQWEPVPTTTTARERTAFETANDKCNTEAVWHCIVHVGDMASLALQHNSPAGRSTGTGTRYHWPSPEHRVQTSTAQKRASLVYFGYPPANTSIHAIRQRLKDWKPSCRGSPLPLAEYYLLQNQSLSATTAEDGNATKERPLLEYYEKLEKLSIREVIQEKWNQVQRSE